MACRADRTEWRETTARFGASGSRWPCRGPQPSASTLPPAADALMARLACALAPDEAGAMTVGILDHLRGHHYLPPASPAASP